MESGRLLRYSFPAYPLGMISVEEHYRVFIPTKSTMENAKMFVNLSTIT